MTTDCTYCGCDVHAHEPVFVEEVRNEERVPAGEFCNYSCLVQHVDAEGLEDGAFCRVDLG